MKRFILLSATLGLLGGALGASESAHGGEASGHAVESGPLTEAEAALVFDPAYRRTDAHGEAFLEIDGEPMRVDLILRLSPWDLMAVVQRLSGTPQLLSRFGSGSGSELTWAWRFKVAAFAQGSGHHADHPEDPFDPGLVLWDPGYLQVQNTFGQWTIALDRRVIVQGDLATLSPLEVSQAVTVLTGRSYPIEFVLENLEAFRAQLTVVPRLVEAVAAHH